MDGSYLIKFLLPGLLGYISGYLCDFRRAREIKAPHQPPPVVFGVIWPILYILLGSAWIMATTEQENNYYLLLSFVLAFWVIVYNCFGSDWGGLAIIILCLCIVAILMSKGSRNQSYLLLPLLIWLSYATTLNMWTAIMV